MEDHYKRKIFNDEKIVQLVKTHLTTEEQAQFVKLINQLPLSKLNLTFREIIREKCVQKQI